MTKKSNTVHQENTRQQFDFKYFTSSDKHQIRWGCMYAQQTVPDLETFSKNTDSALTATGRGIILLLNGRTEFMEKYRGVASKLSCMGFHVISMDWRGQGLSIRELPNRDKGYVRDFQLYLNDLELFYKLHVAPYAIELKLPINIIAHSMGGHIALRFLSEFSNSSNSNSSRIADHIHLSHTDSNNILSHIDITSIQKAILISPMIDIVTSPIMDSFVNSFADWGSRQLAALAVRAGLGGNYIPGGKDYCREDAKFENNVLTHDRDNFLLEHEEIAENRNLALGGVTWGWLKAAFDSIAVLKNEKYLSRIKTPVRIFSAEEDRVVSNKAQKRACQILPNGKFISIPKARHEILFETDEIRELLWNHIFPEI